MDVFQLSKTKKKLCVYDGEKITYFLHEYMFKISNLCSPKYKYCFQHLPKKKNYSTYYYVFLCCWYFRWQSVKFISMDWLCIHRYYYSI